MRRTHSGYKIAVFILCAIIIAQWIMLARQRPVSITKVPAPKIKIKGQIAIVLDDWGYSLDNLAILAQIKYPLTASVLPNLSYSKKVAQELHEKGFEVILHLPMEPHPRQNLRLEKNTILTSMNEQRIRNILSGGLSAIPYVKGVSNHMGSKATEDAKIMSVIFRELKQRRLYFLDSFVSDESVCMDLAHKMRLAFLRRDVFLDNKSDPEYIKGQIYKLKTKAKIYGQAVGIGHDRRVTLEVLREMIPKLAKEGYKFVYASELAR